MLDRLVVLPNESRPERFGRYVLLDRIGAGGMAEVYRAVMPGAEGFRRTFVVKRILAEHAATEKFREMFVREARICGLLNHPGIVQVFDFGQIDGSYFLAMEYVRGRDLQAVMRRLRQSGRPVPVQIAAFVAREVAIALDYAQGLAGADGKPLNIIHRDVSPSNVMCLLAGGVKLLDFGIAATLEGSDEERFERGAFKGKYAYAAPERLRRLPIDGRSDLFSLGVVLWEMLAGARLFRGANDAETIRNVLEARLRPPSAVRPDVPAELDAVVMRALERDPAARYPDGGAMADDLERVLDLVKYQSRMLPDLLHALFGKGLQSGPVTLSPELLEQTQWSVTHRPSQAGTTDPRLASTLAAAPAPRVRRASGLAAGASAVTVTAALAALLLGRGGGATSHATLLRPARSSATLASSPPPGAGARENRVEVVPVPPAEADPGEVAPSPSAATPPARRRTGVRGDGRRISRGLSIDPFADTPRGRR